MNVGSDFRKHDNDGLLNLLIELRVAFNWLIICIYGHQQKLISFFFLVCIFNLRCSWSD